MSTLKVLKTRIQSVQSTRKITAAMYMVAAAKFRRAQKRYDGTKAYADALFNTLTALPMSLLDESDSPLVHTTHSNRTVLIILISADRGLCGSFNSQLFRKAKEYITSLQKDNLSFSIVTVGKKAFDFAKSNYVSHLKSNSPIFLHTLTLELIETLAETITLAFCEDNVTQCIALYNEYASPLQQTPLISTLLPLKDVVSDITSYISNKTYIPYFIPKESTFISHFLIQYLQGVLWFSVAQTLVGEYAARMTAMDNATKNCDDMMNTLNLEYNQTRQARITKELIEVISGAEALQKG
jgi:F-type H+-transporting ATPase subunit gamma